MFLTLEHLLHPISKKPIQVGIAAKSTSLDGTDPTELMREICRLAPYTDIVVAPEYSFFPKAGPLTSAEKDKLLRTLQKHGKNLLVPGTFVWQEEGKMFNTCYVLYGREVICVYHKNTKGNDDLIAEKYGLTISYGSSMGTCSWHGLKLGFEICSDGGRLAGGGVHDLDLAILVASGNPGLARTLDAVKLGGYGIIADGSNKVFGVERKN